MPLFCRFKISLFTFLTIISFHLNMTPLQASGWSSPTDVSIAGFNTTGAQVVIDNKGRSIAIWSGFNGTHFVIQSSTRDSSGTWDVPVVVSTENEDAFYPQIAIDSNGNAAAVWSQKSANHFLIQSAVKYLNQNWSAPLDVSSYCDCGLDALFPQVLFGNEGDIHAIWQKNDGEANVIEYATKEKDHESWSEITIISNATNPGLGCTEPQFAINPYGDLFAIFNNNDVSAIQFALKKVGEEWTLPKKLSTGNSPVANPQIAVDNLGNAIAAWSQSDGHHMIIKAAIRPANSKWSDPINLSFAGQNALFPTLSLNNNNAVVAWQRSDGVYTLIQAATKLGGANWSSVINITKTGQNATNPQVTIGPSNHALVVWKRSNGANFVIQSANCVLGGPWSNPATLSLAGEDAYNPSAAIDSLGDVVAIWQRSDGSHTIVQSSFRSIVK